MGILPGVWRLLSGLWAILPGVWGLLSALWAVHIEVLGLRVLVVLVIDNLDLGEQIGVVVGVEAELRDVRAGGVHDPVHVL